MPTENKEGFLEKIQSLTEEKKRGVLIVGSIVAMVVLVFVWIGYFNGLVVSASQAPDPQAAATSTAIAVVPTPATPPTQTAPSTPSGPSMWQDIKNAAGSFENIFKQPGQYNIQPNGN